MHYDGLRVRAKSELESVFFAAHGQQQGVPVSVPESAPNAGRSALRSPLLSRTGHVQSTPKGGLSCHANELP